jgi:hypothetical protein
MKTYGGEGWLYVFLVMTEWLPAWRNSLWYPLDRRLGGEENNLLPMPEIPIPTKNRETNLKGSHPELNRDSEARRQSLTSNRPYVFMTRSFNTKEPAFLQNNIYIHIQFVPHRKHYVSVTKTSRLMPLRETVAVYCENHMEHTNTLCGQNVQSFGMSML